jgi:hypothetical protein
MSFPGTVKILVFRLTARGICRSISSAAPAEAIALRAFASQEMALRFDHRDDTQRKRTPVRRPIPGEEHDATGSTGDLAQRKVKVRSRLIAAANLAASSKNSQRHAGYQRKGHAPVDPDNNPGLYQHAFV